MKCGRNLKREVVTFRLKVIDFHEKYGTEATVFALCFKNDYIFVEEEI